MTLTPIYFDTLTEYVKEPLSPIKQKHAQMAEDLVDPWTERSWDPSDNEDIVERNETEDGEAYGRRYKALSKAI